MGGKSYARAADKVLFFANPLEVIGPHLLEDAGFFSARRRLLEFGEGSPLSPSQLLERHSEQRRTFGATFWPL